MRDLDYIARVILRYQQKKNISKELNEMLNDVSILINELAVKRSDLKVRNEEVIKLKEEIRHLKQKNDEFKERLFIVRDYFELARASSAYGIKVINNADVPPEDLPF